MTLRPALPEGDARLLEAVDATMDAAARRCGAFPTLVALAFFRP